MHQVERVTVQVSISKPEMYSALGISPFYVLILVQMLSLAPPKIEESYEISENSFKNWFCFFRLNFKFCGFTDLENTA